MGRDINEAGGYIRVHRSFREHFTWYTQTGAPASPAEAWLDLLFSANFKDSQRYDRGELLVIRRGQILTGERALSRRLRWSRSKVRNFLAALQKDKSIAMENDHRRAVLTVCEYDKWQANWTTDRTTEEPQTGPQKDPSKESKESKESKQTYAAEFGLIWAAYPRSENKKPAYDVWGRRGRPSPEIVIAGIERWKLTKGWQDGFIPYLQKFLNNRNWEDTPKPVRVESREEASQGERTPEELEALLKRRGVPGA